MQMHKFLALQLLSLVLAANAAINNGYDRPYSDLPGMPIILDPHSSSSDCAVLCNVRLSCRSWAYDICGRRNCWLKSSIPKIRASGCRVSFVASQVIVARCELTVVLHVGYWFKEFTDSRKECEYGQVWGRPT